MQQAEQFSEYWNTDIGKMISVTVKAVVTPIVAATVTVVVAVIVVAIVS